MKLSFDEQEALRWVISEIEARSAMFGAGQLAKLDVLRAALAQQAQPDMPTREMIAVYLRTAFGRGVNLTGEEWFDEADAVLALFAPIFPRPQNWTPNGKTEEDRLADDMENLYRDLREHILGDTYCTPLLAVVKRLRAL